MSNTRSTNFSFSLREFLLYYLRFWPWYLLSLALALGSAFLYLRYNVPIYNANATLLVKSEGNGGGGDKFEDMFFFKKGDNLVDEIEILKSRNMARRVAGAMNLQTRYYAIGNVKTTLIYPYSPFSFEIIKKSDSSRSINLKLTPLNEHEFFLNDDQGRKYNYNAPFQVGNDTYIIKRVDSLPGTKELQNEEYLLVWEPLESALWLVKGGLNIAKVKDESNLLQLSYNGIHTELGKEILRQLVVEYQEASVEDKNQIASRTNNFINDRLGIITRELGDVEKDLQSFKQKNNLINIESQSDNYLGEISTLDRQLTDLEVRLNVINFLRSYLENSKNDFNVVPTTLGIDEPALGQLVAEYNTLQLKREAELKTTTAENPTIKILDQQLNKLRLDLNENLRTIYSSTDLTRKNLRSKSETFKSSITSMPLKEKELLEIKRQQGIKEALYLYLLQKREETAISLASTISNSKLIDSPIASSTPVKPDRKNIQTIALFLGLVVPTALIYLRELLDDKIGSRKEIEKMTDAPILGEIGHSKAGETLVVRPNSRNAVSEQFRMLRSNLQYLLNNVEGTPVIMTTSTFSGEGKSFITINLAAALAISGRKTVILEFDLRKPKIISNLGLKRSEGFTNYLVGNFKAESLPIPVPGVENLFVIPCGAIPPNPGEMLSDPKVDQLFRYLSREFDAIVMDTAPVGLVSDAQILSKYASCSLYVVRLNYTLKKQLHFIEDLHREEKLPKMALLVNDIDEKASYYSYGTYHYGYGYGYGRGNEYFEPEAQKPWWKFWG